MSSATPRSVRFRAWNLLLLAPFLMLVTPWTNARDPQLLGLPFFYWIQLLWVAVGVASVAAVHLFTRDRAGDAVPGVPPRPADVDALDEGAGR